MPGCLEKDWLPDAPVAGTNAGGIPSLGSGLKNLEDLDFDLEDEDGWCQIA